MQLGVTLDGPMGDERDERDPQQERPERWRAFMRAAQAGDAEAYQRLLHELLPFVRGVVQARLGPDAGSDDVVQEVLLRIHNARHTYRPEHPLLPWVRAIARNASIDRARRRARERRRAGDVELDQLPSASAAPAAPLSEGVVRALDRLPASQREAVTLLKLEGLSVQEAARRAGVSPGALKLRAHRGYRALRELLGPERP